MYNLKNKKNVEYVINKVNLHNKSWHFNEQDNFIEKVFEFDNVKKSVKLILLLFKLSDIYYHHPVVKWNQKIVIVKLKTNDFNFPSSKDIAYILHLEKLILNVIF